MNTKTVTQALTGARSPKTILGFFAIVVGVAIAGITFMISILVPYPELHWLIVCAAVFAGLLVLGILIGVFLIAWKDPTILMLGEISGEVYIENRKLTLGDSDLGEISEVIAVASISENNEKVLTVSEQALALPSPKESEQSS